MKEILFRGKRLMNGEWVDGWLTTIEGVYCIVLKDADRGNYAIAPETIGQFTGMTDVNGKKIFEGDIVKCRDGFLPQMGETDEEIIREFIEADKKGAYNVEIIRTKKGAFVRFFRNYEVLYNAKDACFIAKNGRDMKNLSFVFDAEVIGNIYDNPELLEGEPKQ